MTSATDQNELERRKQVKVRLRPDLVVTEQPYEGHTCYVVKDPASLRYYRFDERDHFLLTHMDGSCSLEEARTAFEARFAPRRLTLEDLEGFAQLLLKAGLAYHDLPHAGAQLFERRTKRRRLEWVQFFTNILYIEFPLVDPDPILRRLLACVGWLLRPWFLVLSGAFMLAALLLVATHFGRFQSMLPSQQEFFTYRNLFALWLALGVTKVLHEFSHGVVCKRLGGEVHDMGVLIMCLSPCLYLNVSDAWTFADKWKRIAVGLAGIWIELLIAAAATFAWWTTPGWPLVHNLTLSLMVVCSLNTLLFNGNPLLRFDGYYVLADWLEIPNLRERCNAYLKRLASKHCLGMEVPPEPFMALWRRLLFVAYAVASYFYGWIVTFGAIWFLAQFLEPYRLGVVSKLLALVAVASMVGWPLYRLGKGLYQRGKLPAMKAPRVALTTAAVLALLIGFFFLPLPVGRVRQPGLVQPRPDAVAKVFVALPGSLERLYVRDGQHVEAGDLLAEFRSLELEGQLEEARSQHAVRLVQLKALRQQAAEVTDAAERARLEIALAQTDGERGVYARQVGLHEKALQLLVLRAPRAGVVMGMPRREEIGKRWEKDQAQPFCTVGDPTRLRALVPVRPADYLLLKDDLGQARDLPVTIRVRGWEARTWAGRISALPESEAQSVPLALTTRAGGPLAIKPGSQAQVYAPQDQHYLVGVDFMGAAQDGVWPGCMAQVKIHCRWRPAAWWVWREINAAFDLGLAG